MHQQLTRSLARTENPLQVPKRPPWRVPTVGNRRRRNPVPEASAAPSKYATLYHASSTVESQDGCSLKTLKVDSEGVVAVYAPLRLSSLKKPSTRNRSAILPNMRLSAIARVF
jgi:hypothetical protein